MRFIPLCVSFIPKYNSETALKSIDFRRSYMLKQVGFFFMAHSLVLFKAY